MRRRRQRKQRKIIIISSLTLLFIMTVGYAAFQTNINITAKGNIIEKRFTANDLKSTTVTTGEGLYKDTYETNRYIYKGANPNNYIIFNNEMWRIYSIETDGKMKIIKEDAINSEFPFDPGYETVISGVTSQNSVTGTRYSNSSSNYCYASSESSYGGCNVWAATSNLVGKPSTFVNGSVSGVVSSDAWLNTYLNSGEYWSSMLSDESKNKIYKEAIWNVGPSGQYESNYSISNLVGQSFEKKYQWIGKVGLLTKSEYMRACNYDILNNSSLCSAENTYWKNSTTCMNYNYLYKSYSYRLISPYYDRYNYVSDARASTGRADFNQAKLTYYKVRPVVFLNSNVLLSGKGTPDKPFKVV